MVQPGQKRSLKQVSKLVVKRSTLEGFTKHLMVVKNISKLLNEKDKFGRTALHVAADTNRYVQRIDLQQSFSFVNG